MSNSLPQLYSYKGQSWDTYIKDMKVTTSQILIDSKEKEECGNVSLLSRKDINIYGTCPKMEVFKLTKCNSCNKMLLPSIFKSHREKFHSETKVKVPSPNTTVTSTPSSSTVVKKKESRLEDKKKKTQSSVPSPQLFPIFQIGTAPLVGTSPSLPTLTVPLTTQRVLLTIPGPLSAIQMYSCHPKPLSMPTPVTRRVGGSFILRNQRLEKQKSEIQMAKCNMISSPTYKTFSVLNMHHKPNILKNNPRGNNKIQGIKRTTNDKSISLEHKQSRSTSDVNGFIIHADVSESAETPQNNCIQKKLTIFNMK